MDKVKLRTSIHESRRKFRRRMERNNLDLSKDANSPAAERAYRQHCALFRFMLATGSL
jgi:hypothetical protein